MGRVCGRVCSATTSESLRFPAISSVAAPLPVAPVEHQDRGRLPSAGARCRGSSPGRHRARRWRRADRGSRRTGGGCGNRSAARRLRPGCADSARPAGAQYPRFRPTAVLSPDLKGLYHARIGPSAFVSGDLRRISHDAQPGHCTCAYARGLAAGSGSRAIRRHARDAGAPGMGSPAGGFGAAAAAAARRLPATDHRCATRHRRTRRRSRPPGSAEEADAREACKLFKASRGSESQDDQSARATGHALRRSARHDQADEGTARPGRDTGKQICDAAARVRGPPGRASAMRSARRRRARRSRRRPKGGGPSTR